MLILKSAYRQILESWRYFSLDTRLTSFLIHKWEIGLGRTGLVGEIEPSELLIISWLSVFAKFSNISCCIQTTH